MVNSSLEIPAIRDCSKFLIKSIISTLVERFSFIASLVLKSMKLCDFSAKLFDNYIFVYVF